MLFIVLQHFYILQAIPVVTEVFWVSVKEKFLYKGSQQYTGLYFLETKCAWLEWD